MNGGWFGVSDFSHYHKRKGILDEMMTMITPIEEVKKKQVMFSRDLLFFPPTVCGVKWLKGERSFTQCLFQSLTDDASCISPGQ